MFRLCALIGLCAATMFSPSVKAPLPPTEVVSFPLVTAELAAKIEFLKAKLADSETYDDQAEFITRASGVIACLAQAAIEHDQYPSATFAGPALRDAALQLAETDNHADAVEALQSVEAAWQGKTSGEHASKHPWNELISMYDLMEEMNDRNGGLSRTLRRSRGQLQEQLNASTNAVLAIAMLADHEYVTDEEDAAEWDQLSKDYQQAMTKLAAAIEKKDQPLIAELYKAGNRACDQCHASFRD